MPQMSSAFSLIELLVVITIIVVLLSLLTPALDKAIYQAELTVCAARLSGIAVGAQTYAASNRRSYPRRPHHEGHHATERMMIYDVDEDDRPELRDFININHALNEPMLPELDFENADPRSWLFASYDLHFGTRPKGERGMLKLGDRWSSKDRNDSVTDQITSYRISVIASDRDLFSKNGNLCLNNHPDSDGLLTVDMNYEEDTPDWSAGRSWADNFAGGQSPTPRSPQTNWSWVAWGAHRNVGKGHGRQQLCLRGRIRRPLRRCRTGQR